MAELEHECSVLHTRIETLEDERDDARESLDREETDHAATQTQLNDTEGQLHGVEHELVQAQALIQYMQQLGRLVSGDM